MKNKKRKMSAAIACMVLLQAASAMPVSAADSYIFNDNFDSSDCGWEGRGGASVKSSSDQPYAGNGALYVSGRTEAWNGAQKDISSVCTPGETYSFSICAATGAEVSSSVTFMLSLVYTGSDDKPVYEHLADAETLGGNYVQLANDSFTIPAAAKDAVLYVETKSGTASFYLDEAICAEQGTQIEGPKPVKFTLGDIDCDGTITAADLALAKTYADKDFPNKTMKKAADVDKSGKVDAADVRWLYSFITGETTAYPEPVQPERVPYDKYVENLQYHDMPGDYLNASANPGKIVKETYQGTTGTNTLYVYLPVGYDESQKYNIFYLLHGGGENENTLFFQDDTMMQNIFDHMIENGDMEPMIIVTPTWNQTGADKFYTEFRDKVVPFVEGKYSTYAESTTIEGLQASRYHRAYGGFSMGSVSTWGVLCNNLDIVAYYMPLSGDYRIDGLNSGYDKAKRIADAIDASGLEKNQYFIFCATGSEDIACPNMTPQVDEMKKMPQFEYSSDLSKGNFYYMVAPGKTHWWGYVRHYVYDVLPFFFHEDNG